MGALDLLAKRRDIDSFDHRSPEVIERLSELLGPVLDAWFRPVVRGLDRIPDGPALYVGNHNGGTLTPDTFVLCAHLVAERGVDFVPWGLAHELPLVAPVFGEILGPLGAVRASHENATRLFDAGHKVMVYPGGDLDAMRSYRDRKRVVFGPRRGYIRLALRHGVPIVPVVSAGAHEGFHVLTAGRDIARLIGADRYLRLKVWPVVFSIPWGITVGPPMPYLPMRTRIYQSVMEPIHFDRSGEDAANDRAYVESCHTEVWVRMQAELLRLYDERDAAA